VGRCVGDRGQNGRAQRRRASLESLARGYHVPYRWAQGERATQDRLRKGLVEPDAHIDLHGMTQAAAHRTLASWLSAAHRRGHRLVVVVTGKGNPKNDENAAWMSSAHGVLKQMVPRWLNEPELAALIADVRPAHVKHGGGGALYVYLRKS